MQNEGPPMARFFRYGRFDESSEPVEEVPIESDNLPDPNSPSFFSDVESKGFTKEETVALGALLAYGKYWFLQQIS